MRDLAGSYDAVVVGGGHNGLTAAAYLAAAGRSCLLVERGERLGGAATSGRPFDGVDAQLSRYAYLVSLLPRQIVSELALPLRLRSRRIASYTPDPRDRARRGLLVDRRDLAATEASFASVTGSGRGWHEWSRLHDRLRWLARLVFPTLTEPLRPPGQLRRSLDDEPLWEAIFERPLGESLSAWLADELLEGVVLTDALIGTFAEASEPDLRQNRCFLYHVIGGGTGEWRVPVGGMGSVSDAFAAAARRAGAELRTGLEVTALEPEADRVRVLVSDGAGERALSADRVLVNASPAELERLLGAGGGAPAAEGSQLKVNMVLSRLPRLRDRSVAPETAFAGTLHVNETATQLQLAHAQAALGRIPEMPPCECYCHSLTDASILGPEPRRSGAHALTIFVLHMPRRLFAGDPEGARGAALEATLRSLDSVLAEPISDCVMADADGAVCIEAHSPLDIERDLRMPGGHIFHGDLAWPFAESDEEVGRWGVETGHPRVLICGAGARRGGGVSGIPGRNAAMAALGDPGRRPRRRASARARHCG